jgi:DNA-nicking Smr family endonuclease
MRGRRGLSDDERAVWETATRQIKPLKPGRKVVEIEVVRAVVTPPRKASAVKHAPAVKPPASKAPPPLASLSRREKQRAARGHDPIDARLDLHGHTQSEAHAALLRFLRRASTQEARLVLVITGKSGVLRRQVPLWLAMPEFRALAIATEAAAIRHGGEGALYIRVRRGGG